MNLTNNHNSMKTVVETFVIEETAELIYDDQKLDKWNDLVSKLELTGQKTIVKPDKSPIPFMHMKSSLVNVFQTLCPRKVEIEEYNITPIPLEILELVELSTRENYFSKIKIWYDDKNPDPVCVGVNYSRWYGHKDDGGLDTSFHTYEVAKEYMDLKGYKKNKPYGTDEVYYLIGKWGDVKHSFDELKEMAKQRFLLEETNELQKQISKAKRKLEEIENTAFEKFN